MALAFKINNFLIYKKIIASFCCFKICVNLRDMRAYFYVDIDISITITM